MYDTLQYEVSVIEDYALVSELTNPLRSPVVPVQGVSDCDVELVKSVIGNAAGDMWGVNDPQSGSEMSVLK